MTEQGFVEIGEPRMARLLMSRDIGSVHVEIMLEVEDLSSKIDASKIDVSKLLRDCLAATEEAIEEVNKRFFDEFAADQWRKERL